MSRDCLIGNIGWVKVSNGEAKVESMLGNDEQSTD